MNLVLIWLNSAALNWVKTLIPLAVGFAWPVLVGSVIFAFRKPLVTLIENVKKVTAGPVSVDIEKGLAQTAESLVQLVEDSGSEDYYNAPQASRSPLDEFNAQTPVAAGIAPQRAPRIPLREYFATNAEENPKSAIILAFIELEKWYDHALRSHGIEIYDGWTRRSVRVMAKVAVDQGLEPESSINTVEGLSLMRDLVVEKPGEEVSPQQAREFLVLTDGVIYTLSTELAKYEKDNPPREVDPPLIR
jgi:hypothetical protein